MKKVLITGANGFMGKNLCAELDRQEGIKILRFGSENTHKELQKLVQEADFIFHFAGVNRPVDDVEFDLGNRELTQIIVAALQKLKKQTPVFLSSSIQAELDNPYGKSKKAAEEAIFELEKSNGNPVYAYRLPNVFGKWCKPNYNSVVATFCNNIASGKDISINDPNTKLTLIYIDDIIRECLKCLSGEVKPSTKPLTIQPQFTITLKELADKIYAFKNSRKTILLPNFENDFDRYIYATYTSYLETHDFGYDLEMKHDDRGWLGEFLKSKQFGQIFVSKTKPGITRGNHWHHTKIEKFLVVSGEAEIKFRKLETEEVYCYKVTGDQLRVLDIPAGYTHSIKNTGNSDLITIFWSDEIFNPEAPDTNFLEV